MNLKQIKEEFPLLSANPKLVYLDNAATTQKPAGVLKAMEHFYLSANANIHRGVYGLAEKADQLFDSSRQTVADFVGVSRDELVFTKNATEGANLLAFGIGEALVRPGDNVIVTELEHHANYLPWQEMAKRRGAELRIWPVDPETLLLQQGWLEKNTDQQTRVVAVTMMSNVLGYGADIENVVSVAHRHGALVILDAVQGVVHRAVNLTEMGVDAAFWTGHKLYGPMGTGAVYLTGDLAAKIPPMLTGGGMIMDLPDKWFDSPAKFEAGTPDVAGIVGLAEAIRFLQEIGLEHLSAYENNISLAMRQMLNTKSRVKLLSPKEAAQSSIISFEVDGLHPHDLASIFAEDDICARAGHHCAKPLLNRLGIKALTRISLGIYNQLEDVEKVEASLDRALEIFS